MSCHRKIRVNEVFTRIW